MTPEKISAYGYSYSSGGWSFIGKARGSIIEATALGLGKVAIIEDTNAPLISSVLQSKSTKSRQPNLSCQISDDISGLALDEGISMSLDGFWVPAEYDIDSGKFRYKVRNPLKAGKHLLEMKASDNQGNTAVKSVTFTVLGQ